MLYMWYTYDVQVLCTCCTGGTLLYRCTYMYVVQRLHTCCTGSTHTVQVRRYDMSTLLALTKWPPNIQRILKHAISSLRVTLQAQQTYLNSLLTFILFISLFQISVIIQ